MTSRALVETFVAQKVLALVGASRSGKKFGNAVLKELTAKGYTIYPIHPEASSIDGHQAYPSFAHTPTPPLGVIVIVPPTQAEQVVRAAHAAGIGKIWPQQGAGSPEAVRYCQANGLEVVDGECILMFTDPTAWYHKAHRWIWKVTGRLPS